jgi:cytochrome c556
MLDVIKPLSRFSLLHFRKVAAPPAMAAAISSLLFLGSVTGTAADSGPDFVHYRQALMKAMSGHMTATALVVKKQISDRSQLVAHAEALRGTAAGLTQFFPPSSGPDKVRTAAKAEVWRDWKRFNSEANEFARATAKLAEVARAGDEKAFAVQFAVVGTSCNECHEQFRVRDNDD